MRDRASELDGESIDRPRIPPTTREPQGRGGEDLSAEPSDRIYPENENTYFRPQPPSKEELKRQYRQPGHRQIDYDIEFAKNKKAALKEIMQENVDGYVRVTDENLNEQFREGAKGERR